MKNTAVETDKQNGSKWWSKYYLFLILLLFIGGLSGGIYFLKNYRKQPEKINAKLHKNEIYLNEELIYSDNTVGSNKWLWEFGNGDYSKERQGTYRFLKAGSYVVRLTVNDRFKEDFIIVVKDTIPTVTLDTAFHISGTTHGLIKEEIRLEVEGPGDVFEWWFGETNRVDAVGRSALYTYSKPGDYVIRVKSDKNPEGTTHQIHIIDPEIQLKEIISPGALANEALNEFKKKIQAIADGKNFQFYYNSILSQHLCNNEKVKVQVEMDNVKKQMDLYSYLLGLTFSKGLLINELSVSGASNGNSENECPNLIIIKQSK